MEDMAFRFERDVLMPKPETVIILGGSNDVFWGDISCSMTVSFLEQMVASAIDNKVRPVIGIPMPIDDPIAGPKLELLIRGYHRIATELMLPILDFRTPFTEVDTGRIREELYLDGCHPNLMGYRVMGETAVHFFRTKQSGL
jgi:lysophospholipase L1-like esterase